MKRSPFTRVVMDISKALNVPAVELIETEQDSLVSELQQMLAPLTPPGQAIFLFGSRSRKTAKKFSDIDVGIMAEK